MGTDCKFLGGLKRHYGIAFFAEFFKVLYKAFSFVICFSLDKVACNDFFGCPVDLRLHPGLYITF